MQLAADVVIAAIALLHAYFLVLEMFLWTKRPGLKAFGLTPEFARSTRVLAANQGLYNGFLAAGLLCGLLLDTGALQFKVFFLTCVAVAGVFGAVTVNRKILFVQALPALVALSLLLAAQ